MVNRSVLLSSNYSAWPEVFNGQAYAFLNVIRQLERADLLCPQPAHYTRGRGINPRLGYLWRESLHRAHSHVVRQLGRPGTSNAQSVKVERDYDVFMFMCQFPLELTALSKIKGWRERSGMAVAYILESWQNRFPFEKAELKLLDKFDHVFVLNADCIPDLQKYTTAPVSFLPSACDTLMATPFPGNPARCIDVLSMGRRIPKLHDKLVQMSVTDPDFFYVHDTSRGGAIANFHEHRLQSAAMIKRSKYFIAYDFSVDDSGPFAGVVKRALATRYFEGAAGGAVMVGSPQQCPEFKEHLDWEDVVIELPPDTTDVRGFFADLDSQRERMARIRTTNVAQSLRRHDWAHRWDQILHVLGLERSPLLESRLDELDSLASTVETTSRVTRMADFRVTA